LEKNWKRKSSDTQRLKRDQRFLR